MSKRKSVDLGSDFEKKIKIDNEDQEDADRIQRILQFTVAAVEIEQKTPLLLKKKQQQRIAKPEEALQMSRRQILKNQFADDSLIQNRKIYLWSTQEDPYPPHIDDEHLPATENHPLLSIKDLSTIFLASEAALHAVSLFPNYSSRFKIPILGSAKKQIETHCDNDLFFGYLRLAGPDANRIRKITQLDALLSKEGQQLLAQELSCISELQKEISKGTLFIEEYHFLGCPSEPGLLVVSPLIIFWQDPQRGFRPLLIQLENDKIFTPGSCSANSWLFAKAAANSAYFVQHEILSHLMETHLLMEIAIVATYRQLPPLHPVTGLILDHSYRTLALNHSARLSLVPKLIPASGVPLSLSSHLLQTKWKLTFKFFDSHFRHQLQSRLYPDCKEPISVATLERDFPEYHYAHDALALWDILREYHAHLLHEIYKGTGTWESDAYLQKWFQELADKIPGFPQAQEIDLETLIDIVTIFVFQATVQHSAVNYPQERFFQNARFISPLLKGPWPKNHLAVTEEELCRAYPNKFQVSIAYALVTILSAPVKGENIVESFGSYTQNHNDLQVFDLHLLAQQSILYPKFQTLSQKITDRKPSPLSFSYEYLHPKQVAKSILM